MKSQGDLIGMRGVAFAKQRWTVYIQRCVLRVTRDGS
jgi:hypothetical protein